MDPLPNDLDEILPNLFLGNLRAAQSTPILQKHRITHVLSLTHSRPSVPEDACVMHKHFPLLDTHQQNILSVLEDCLSFITSTLDEPANRILVHCFLGKSRSGGVVVAYVMKLQNLTLTRAHAYVKAKRPLVHPNRAFRSQLELWGSSGYDSSILDDCEIVDFGFGNEEQPARRRKRSKTKTKDVMQELTRLLPEGWGVVRMDDGTRARFEKCLDDVGIGRMVGMEVGCFE